ncbi:MAG: aminotransferase class III-fold pyridoxal phosphate-dependent enzyme [Betaproteobacteria bacterium]|nr:aminotransferase class III-fold pyridoxal phosphate-dependent enzyme [Betaproteobacteria bacterium]
MNIISPATAEQMLQRERTLFVELHPASRRAFEAGQENYLYGAPSHWMRRWAGGFPLYVDEAKGAHLRCIDGVDYTDFCLGDTGGMCGHGPAPVTEAVAMQMSRGATHMLPTNDARWVGKELARRFGLPYWGFTTSASDANRAVIRMARMITGRERVLVFNGCYHGSVEEAHVALDAGSMVMRNGIHPNAVDHSRVSRVIEFNDRQALKAALADKTVACVLTEPFMTNYGMIPPDDGFLEFLQAECRSSGTLLVIDETHTFSSGYRGYACEHGIEADFFVVGKAVGGGIPVGLYGMSESVARAMWATVPKVDPTQVRQSAHLGFGGTLAGSALQVAAVRAALEHVLTPDAFERMVGIAEQMARSAREVIARHGLAWIVVQIGSRIELLFSSEVPRNASEVAAHRDGILEAALHLFMMNRGVLITPFHSMLLTCPATREQDADRFVRMLDEFCAELVAGGRAVA